ncbi:hypothetical protein G7K_4889-t1 [Saitoella complicata NRRL Y-17804]|uniref:Uncharacterized protein n=1 Tax=Saitoella complicata (strain BCRC 22490 / CBS 7301 / JCM 7358 / NBRC 10748 / NRRL Y-17804) TaxID=698492 RepID=A0A0E9NLT8_SAICN|nr:hypothetical protein G7K_4889-t1 [Saitoella complicata NRRL Y-17804]
MCPYELFIPASFPSSQPTIRTSPYFTITLHPFSASTYDQDSTGPTATEDLPAYLDDAPPHYYSLLAASVGVFRDENGEAPLGSEEERAARRERMRNRVRERAMEERGRVRTPTWEDATGLEVGCVVF